MAENDKHTTPKESITPSFLGGGEDNKDKTDENAPKNASGKVLGGKDFESNATEDLNNAENSAEGGLYNSNDNKSDGKNATESAANAEESPGRFSRFGFGKGKAKKKGKGKKLALIASLGGVLFSSIFAIGLVGIPMLLIGTIDMNLQCTVGICGTTAILEKQSEYVTAEMSTAGEFPAGFSNDLADNGIYVGQVTASGDFVRTDTYIADIDKLTDIATMGHFQANPTESGQLAFLFDNQIINASDFVATVESNPTMYAAFTEATDISARYYYSNGVQEVYDNAGISRNLFRDWKKTHDHETNMQTFNEIKDKALNAASSLNTAGCSTGDCSESGTLSNGSNFAADTIISKVSSAVDGKNASAAELLNMAASASEPYLAATAFVIVEEPIQRARADGTGPVNELMDALGRKKTVTYTDVVTGEKITSEKSVLETTNFAAAISRGTFSKKEANNFSRDRILLATGNADNTDLIQNTSISTNGKKNSSIATNKDSQDEGDSVYNDSSKSSVEIALSKKNSDLFTSVVGGNRIVEGGSFLSKMINTKNIGAMASDSATVAAYNREVETILARRAAADRATLSPFDISSSHTFLGSIVYNFANSVLRNPSSSSPTTSGLNTIGNFVQSSTKNLFGSAIADGDDDETFATLEGECSTVKVALAVGDLYCTSHNTVSTGYMHYTKEDWANSGIGVDISGNIEGESGYADFTNFAMDREATVGIKSADICKAYKAKYDPGLIINIISGLSKLFGTYQECNDGVGDGIATGVKYTLNSSNTDTLLYSGYALYDTVSSLLKNKKSNTAIYRDTYYAAHPRDNSPAGRLARISGMTKEEATIALNYASYLTYLANYDPSTRYAFGVPTFTQPIDFTPTFINPSSNSPLLALLSQTPTKNNV